MKERRAYVVDDDAGLRKTIVRMLRDDGTKWLQCVRGAGLIK